MRIVQIGGAFAGAQEKIKTAIHHELLSRGFESYIFNSVGKSDDPNIMCCGNLFTTYFTRIARRIFGKAQKFSIFQTTKLLWLLDRTKPDVVHLHVIHHGYYDYEMLFKYLARNKLPAVYTMHDMWTITGGCYHFSGIKCENYKTGCKNCPNSVRLQDCSPHKTPLHFQKKSTLLHQLDSLSIVSVSHWVNEQISNSYLDDIPRYVIRNGMNTETLAWLRHMKPCSELQEMKSAHKDMHVLLAVANHWGGRKGIDFLLRVAGELGNEFMILIMGGVPRKYRSAAPQNVVFRGYIDSAETMMNYFQYADLHISVSVEETFGMTFLEAALMGTKSVGFRSTAIPEVIKAVHGEIVEDYSVSAFSKKIRELFAFPNRNKLGTDEIAQIEKEFSSDRMAGEYIKLYKKVYNKP